MKKINLREVAEHDIRSCNSCLARNYKSENFDHIGEYVDKLYSLDIGQMSICLCYDCLHEISATIESLTSMNYPTEKGGVQE